MTARFTDHILVPGLLSARPAANTVPAGTLYPATDTGITYRSDGAAWADWTTGGDAGSGLAAHLVDAHDASAISYAGSTDLAATDVEAALDELDTEKSPTGHTHTSARTINAQVGTAYTLVVGDAGDFVTMTNAAASTLTVPPDVFAVGDFIEGGQLGAGQVTLTPGVGVTINGTPGLKVAAQYGTFGLLQTATNVWLAYGRLAA